MSIMSNVKKNIASEDEIQSNVGWVKDVFLCEEIVV